MFAGRHSSPHSCTAGAICPSVSVGEAQPCFGGGPVGGDGGLGVGEGDAVVADGAVEGVFDFVFGVGAGVGFGPEVAGVVGAPPSSREMRWSSS